MFLSDISYLFYVSIQVFVKCHYFNLTYVDPPMMFGPPGNVLAYINQPYLMQCPLVSNPQSTCMWRVFECFDFNSTIHNVSDYGISFDECSLYISKVTVRMRNICFSCHAMNRLGSDEYFFNNLDFSCKFINEIAFFNLRLFLLQIVQLQI